MAPVCALCSLPAAHPLTRDERSFCCLGCLNVYTILRESGILAEGVAPQDTPLFQQARRLGLISNALQEKSPPPAAAAETKESVYHISGMWCASCAWLIEQSLAAEPGIRAAEVLFTSDLLRVKYCPQYLPPERIAQRVAGLGYRLSPHDSQSSQDDSERRDLLLRTGIAAFLWLNVMAISLVIYASYWEAISDAARRIVPLVLMALTTPAVFYSAWPILRLAARGALARVLRMEALVALGILAAYTYSAVQAFTGGRHYYFDTACAIVTLVLLGKLLEREAKQKTAESIALLYRMMPGKARVLAGPGNHDERFVAIEALAPGMRFLVKPGERIPADGIVAAGDSHVDESVLTGESAPQAKRPGDSVVAGSLNTAGVLEVEATRVGAASTLHHMARAVEAAMRSRSRVERAVDRASRLFVPALIALAALTFAGCIFAGIEPAPALLRAIAVLVIACPCALGIATPLAITAAVGAASRRGILVRDSSVLETIARIDVVVLDKTGTVTEGAFGVVGPASDALCAQAAALERYSEHPIGRAAVRHAQTRGLRFPEADTVAVHRGMGIAGTVAGRAVAIGNRGMMRQAGAILTPAAESSAAQWEARGCTVAWIAADGELQGAIALGDQIRPEAASLVRELKRRGIRTALISGDAAATTAWVAREIGVDEYRAGVLPDAKVSAVQSFQLNGRRVAMLGDGINDAPALAAADLGIALGSGSDLAMEAAPVVLMSPNLSRVIEVFDAARFTFRVVRQNLFWAFFYNAAGIVLAITGILSPIFAAAAMVCSSLTVIGNSMRLSRRPFPDS